MSVEAITAVLHHSESSGTAKVVLLGIANHDGDGGAWPGIATLAKYARCSESAVHRAITKLVGLGELRVHANAGGNAETRPDRRPNRYDVLVGCPEECDGTTRHGVAPVTPRALDGVASPQPRGSASAPNGVARARPEPSLEPSSNTSGRARRSDPRADGIVKAWWGELEPKPMQTYVAVRAVVDVALKAGHEPERVLRALRSITADPPVVKWKLEKALAAGRRSEDPAGMNWDR